MAIYGVLEYGIWYFKLLVCIIGNPYTLYYRCLRCIRCTRHHMSNNSCIDIITSCTATGALLDTVDRMTTRKRPDVLNATCGKCVARAIISPSTGMVVRTRAKRQAQGFTVGFAFCACVAARASRSAAKLARAFTTCR